MCVSKLDVFVSLVPRYEYELMGKIESLAMTVNNNIVFSNYNMFRYNVLVCLLEDWRYGTVINYGSKSFKEFIIANRKKLDDFFPDIVLDKTVSDLEKIEKANIVVLEFGNAKQTGNFVFLGMAIALKKPIIIIGKYEDIKYKTSYAGYNMIRYVSDVKEAKKILEDNDDKM